MSFADPTPAPKAVEFEDKDIVQFLIEDFSDEHKFDKDWLHLNCQVIKSEKNADLMSEKFRLSFAKQKADGSTNKMTWNFLKIWFKDELQNGSPLPLENLKNKIFEAVSVHTPKRDGDGYWQNWTGYKSAGSLEDTSF